MNVNNWRCSSCICQSTILAVLHVSPNVMSTKQPTYVSQSTIVFVSSQLSHQHKQMPLFTVYLSVHHSHCSPCRPECHINKKQRPPFLLRQQVQHCCCSLECPKRHININNCHKLAVCQPVYHCCSLCFTMTCH